MELEGSMVPGARGERTEEVRGANGGPTGQTMTSGLQAKSVDPR